MEFAIEHTDPQASFNAEQLAELWKQFVLSPTCIEEKNLFLMYLMRYKEDSRTGYLFSLLFQLPESIPNELSK